MKLMHLTDKVDPLIVKAVDVSLILYAEHDFNASTFAARYNNKYYLFVNTINNLNFMIRVTVSTLSDFYSGVTSAIGNISFKINIFYLILNI